MKFQCIISFFFASSQIFCSTQPSWFEDILAGTYFRYASTSGNSTNAKDVFTFLKNHMSANSDWKKMTIENDDFNFSYFLKCNVNKNITDIIALPITHKRKQKFYFFTLDSRYRVETSEKLLSDLTVFFIEVLHKAHSGNLKIHFLVLQALPYIGLDSILHKFFSTDLVQYINCSGHCQYAEFFIQNDDFKLSIVDPMCFKLKDHFEIMIDNKKGSYETLCLWHQITNLYDCGLFSMIYLLYAINGTSPNTLTNVQVRLGFKKWIEGPTGFNSMQTNNNEYGETAALQQSRISKITGVWRKMVDVMLYAPRITETAFILGSVGMLYYGASKLTSYLATTKLMLE